VQRIIESVIDDRIPPGTPSCKTIGVVVDRGILANEQAVVLASSASWRLVMGSTSRQPLAMRAKYLMLRAGRSIFSLGSYNTQIVFGHRPGLGSAIHVLCADATRSWKNSASPLASRLDIAAGYVRSKATPARR